MNRERKSGLELLRIICMFGIISMHSFGPFRDSCTGSSRIYGCAINSIFNMGVSVFALMTGYFGNTGRAEKIIKMWTQVVLYSLFSMMAGLICPGGGISFDVLVKGFFPVFSKKYWYVSCYMVLSLLAGPVNQFVDSMSREQFQKFLGISIFIFSVMPTILLGHSITGDGGKGIVHFLLMYFIGRYIRRYYSSFQIQTAKWTAGWILIIGMEFSLNWVLSRMLYGEQGIYCPFAADDSVFVLAGSICIFFIFRQCPLHSTAINRFASCVFAMYLSEGAVRNIINCAAVLNNYEKDERLPFIISVQAICIMGICAVIEWMRRLTIAKLDMQIQGAVQKTAEKIRRML